MKRVVVFIGIVFLLIIGLTGCSNSSSGESEQNVVLAGTTWKTTFTENIGDSLETYNIFLAFGDGVVNLTDNSSDPSNENGVYSVNGRIVTITITSMGIINRSGTISENKLTGSINLGMGSMIFSKQ